MGKAFVNFDAVRDRCERAVGTLPLRMPFEVKELVVAIAERRGRAIHLHGRSEVLNAPCGLWVSTDRADHIFYDRSTTPVHQRHIALHELGHLLLAHDGTPLSDAWVRRVLPSLDPATVTHVLGRSSYADEDEFAAELFASMVIDRVSRLDRSLAAVSAARRGGVARRLTAALATAGEHG